MKPTPPDNSRVRVLLTAAGVGSRLRPLTDTVPKALIPIAGRPLLDYWFDAFAHAGIRHVLINTHHLPGAIDAYVAGLNASGKFEVRTTHEPTLLGSAGTIGANRDFVPEQDEALIIYSDNLSDIDLSRFLAFHRAHDDPFTMLLFRAQFPEKSGIAELAPSDPRARAVLSGTGKDGAAKPYAGECGKIVSFIEKPKQPKSNLANAGAYALTGALWHEVASWAQTQGAFDIGFDVLPRLVGRMQGVEIAPELGSYHRDIGTHESLAIANREWGGEESDKAIER